MSVCTTRVPWKHLANPRCFSHPPTQYVGESERAVRQVFSRARTSSPCVIFFDELDALVPRRDDTLSESSSRVVNTLLTELDGLESRGQVYVIGATNRPDMIDPAMCRPGRLDKLCYVDLPNEEERGEILKTLTKKSPLGEDVELQLIASENNTRGYSGADLYAVVRESATIALQAALRSSIGDEIPTVKVTQDNFLAALLKVRPSVSKDQRDKYAALRLVLSGAGVAPPSGAKRSSRRRGVGGRGDDGGGDGGGDDGPALA